MLTSLIVVLIIGFLAGALAKMLMPGHQGGGFVMTTILGVIGAYVGFFLFTELLGIGDSAKFDLGSLPGAVIGAMLVVFVYEKFLAPHSKPAL